MEVVFRPEAELDLADATQYCLRGGPFSARRFVDRVDERLRFLSNNPEWAPVVYSRFRRLLLHPYPFGLFYHIANDRLFVIAVLDLRQDPTKIKSRLLRPGS